MSPPGGHLTIKICLPDGHLITKHAAPGGHLTKKYAAPEGYITTLLCVDSSVCTWERGINITWKNYTLRITVLWDVKPCSLVEDYQHFGGTYCLHVQGTNVTPTPFCPPLSFLPLPVPVPHTGSTSWGLQLCSSLDGIMMARIASPAWSVGGEGGSGIPTTSFKIWSKKETQETGINVRIILKRNLNRYFTFQDTTVVSIFWILRSETSRRFGGIALPPHSQSYSLALKMEATYSCETPVVRLRTSRSYNPEVRTSKDIVLGAEGVFTEANWPPIKSCWRTPLNPPTNIGDPMKARHLLSWLMVSQFPSVSPSKCQNINSIRLRLLPFKSFRVHHSSTALTFNDIQGVPGGQLNILGGHSIGPSKQKKHTCSCVLFRTVSKIRGGGNKCLAL
jgi:hypothetical protein